MRGGRGCPARRTRWHARKSARSAGGLRRRLARSLSLAVEPSPLIRLLDGAQPSPGSHRPGRRGGGSRRRGGARRLLAVGERLRSGLARAGVSVAPSYGPIIPLILGEEARALAWSRRLAEAGGSHSGDPSSDGAQGHVTAANCCTCRCTGRRGRPRRSRLGGAAARCGPAMRLAAASPLRVVLVGTGTGVGKTHVACALLAAWAERAASWDSSRSRRGSTRAASPMRGR